MNRNRLAQKLIESRLAERKTLLERHATLCDVELAKALQNICYEVWTSAPQKISVIVSTLRLLNKSCPDAEIKAGIEWTKAIESLVGGELEICLRWLDKSEKSFNVLGKTHAAATTQISKLYALALLGRYDEAVACGLRAREVFLAHSDMLSAGKIEHNIGNLYWRRDFYREAEPFLASAHRRFQQAKDQRQLAMVENSQAFVKALQNDFRAAEDIYGRALKRAKNNSLTVTEAEIQTGLSNLFLFQGKFDRALDFMERSRRRYEQLSMPHQSAACELEIADIYLELNLLAEARELYERAAENLAALGMQAELARASLNHARALLFSGEREKSLAWLDRAEKLFQAEGNQISIANAYLLKTRIYLRENDWQNAESYADNARRIFVEGANRRGEITARWLLGEIYLAMNDLPRSRRTIEETLTVARENFSPVEYFCLTSLGIIARRENNFRAAENYFLQAVELTENTRALLAAEEFRTAFAADKLLPYYELVKLKLKQSDVSEALRWLERSRSRVLFEMIGGDSSSPKSTDPEESALFAKYKTLRDELNWFYSRLNRDSASGLEARREKADLRRATIVREKELAEISRRLEIGGNRVFGQLNELDIASLQSRLRDTTLIEYFAFESRIAAFVLTESELRIYENLADVRVVEEELRQFLFQIKTGRFIEKLNADNRRTAVSRAISHSRKLHSLLVAPIAEHQKNSRLTIVPFGALHYLPFQSLHDGERFLVEKYEISYAPSAAILNIALQRKPVGAKSALLVGIADRFAPAVKTEIKRVGDLFEHSAALVNRRATLKNLKAMCGEFDIVHLACHGKFRPDNPLFSALEMAGENLTAAEARGLDLADKLIVLSACETGLNRVEDGEELLGLTRGFWAAGATSLVLSLWTVNDATTQKLMVDFYINLRGGSQPAQALRQAQISILRENPHPFFWSPFVSCGHY
jgi:CHAT domain-containing protein